MAFATNGSLEAWEKTLPYSKMVYPSSFGDRIKYLFWRLYTPFHPIVRDIAIALRVVKHKGRQNFVIGKIAPEKSFKEILNFLVENGYGNHFIAWKDDGEIASLRKVVDFKRQYHVRIFQDREIRGHFEYTPECYPILHFKAVNQQNCREEILQLLGDKVIPEK